MKKRSAFTTIELVIVIAVVAILSAVLIPTFGNLISDAQNSARDQKAKNAYTAFIYDHPTETKENIVIEVVNAGVKYYYVVTDGQLDLNGESPNHVLSNIEAIKGDGYTVYYATESNLLLGKWNSFINGEEKIKAVWPVTALSSGLPIFAKEKYTTDQNTIANFLELIKNVSFTENGVIKPLSGNEHTAFYLITEENSKPNDENSLFFIISEDGYIYLAKISYFGQIVYFHKSDNKVNIEAIKNLFNN